jgi:hypothetical protein
MSGWSLSFTAEEFVWFERGEIGAGDESLRCGIQLRFPARRRSLEQLSYPDYLQSGRTSSSDDFTNHLANIVMDNRFLQTHLDTALIRSRNFGNEFHSPHSYHESVRRRI